MVVATVVVVAAAGLEVVVVEATGELVIAVVVVGEEASTVWVIVTVTREHAVFVAVDTMAGNTRWFEILRQLHRK